MERICIIDVSVWDLYNYFILENTPKQNSNYSDKCDSVIAGGGNSSDDT